MKKKFIIISLLLGAFAFQSVQAAPGANRPRITRPEIRAELPEELKELITGYRAEKVALRTELKALIAELEEPTEEDIQAVKDAFKEDNAERITAQKELASQIREEVKEIRGDRPVVSEEARERFKEKRAAILQLRQDLKAALEEATTEEERETIIAEYREQIKAERRAIREERRNRDTE